VKSKEEGVRGTGFNPYLPRHDLPKGLKYCWGFREVFQGMTGDNLLQVLV
jgi:hypothetical protein